MFAEAVVLFAFMACMTVKMPPEAQPKAGTPTTQPARPDLPVVCRQINEWTTANWPSAQTGVLGPQPK